MLSRMEIKRVVEIALWEDLGFGDVTTDLTVPNNIIASGNIVARENGILAGMNVAEEVFFQVDENVKFDKKAIDGDLIKQGQVLAYLKGKASSILAAERVALNFLQRMSGIATLTADYVKMTEGTKARIVDTRKTTPGLRLIEKYAVFVGGGFNHRINLGDGVLIKDNHLQTLSNMGIKLGQAVKTAKDKCRHNLKIIVEVRSPSEALEAVDAGADVVLLDNMSIGDMRTAIEFIQGRALVEASGNMILDRIQQVAQTGVDIISVGALTHSYRSLDIALDFHPI